MAKVQPEDCLFCKIAKKEITARIAFEDDRFVAFHDINPQAPTHILIIPREHVETINDLTGAHKDLIGGMVLTAQKLAERMGIAEPGYRLIFNCNEGAGQTVWHVHMHLLGGRAMGWPPG